MCQQSCAFQSEANIVPGGDTVQRHGLVIVMQQTEWYGLAQDVIKSDHSLVKKLFRDFGFNRVVFRVSLTG